MTARAVSACGSQACVTCGLCRQQPPIETFSVGRSTSERIEAEAATIIARRSPTTETEKVLVAETVYREIKREAPEMIAFLDQIQQRGGPSAIGIKGLPFRDAAVAEIVSLALGMGLGDPFQYLQQNDGLLAARLAPKTGATVNSNASREDFLDHTDDAFLSWLLRTKFIGLYGIINEGNASTGYTPIYQLAQALADRVVAVLREFRFVFRVPASFNLGDNRWSEPQPILWDDENGDLSVSCPTYNTRVASQDDREAEAALQQLIDLLATFRTYFTVGPGDYLLFNNDRGLHSRRPIVGDRLVLRSYWRKDLNALRTKSGSSGYVFDLNKLI